MLLNLALVGGAACWLGRPRDDAVSEERCVAPAARAPLMAETLPSAGQATASVAYRTNGFRWSRIETNHLVPFALNLRAIGCPGKTIRELINARAVRALDRLGRDPGPKLPFWTAGLRRERAEHEAEREALAERDKILASVEQVLGPGSFPEDPKLREEFVDQAILRFVSGPMSEATFSRLRMALARQEARQEEIRARARGVVLAADERAMKQVSQQFRAELAAILSPAEFEELSARFGIMKSADRVSFEATDLTLAEIRELGRLHWRFGAVGPEKGFGGDNLSEEEEAQLTRDLRQFLGEPRYAEFERATDHDFKTLFELGKDNQLPREVAVQAFDLRQLTAAEVAALRGNKSLSDGERQQRLAAMQAETQAAMLKVLGATACQQYLQRGGSWVTNLSGL